MQILDAAAVAAATPYPALIDALAEAFAGRVPCTAPPRGHHAVARPGEADRTLLVMPSWGADGGVVVKLVNAVPGNLDRGLPSIMGQVLVSDPETGAWAALLDGAELTARRTAAASAQAARHLARADASTMAMLGTGRLSRALIEAMAAVRPIRRVRIWGRTATHAETVAGWAREAGFDARACERDEAVRGADIVSCATLSTDPLVAGAWLEPGMHLDLVGAFKPTMRESDGAAVARARVFVDTRPGALSEGGDLVQAAAEGAFAPGQEEADLAELCRGVHPGRRAEDEITLFKSVGASIEDYAAARLALGVA
jgi:ornithine cyclodeaminase